MTRLHPFEHVFGSLAGRMDSLAAALVVPGAAVVDLATFATLPEVRAVLDGLESPELIHEYPAAAGEYLLLLYVAARYVGAGSRTLEPEREPLAAAMRDPLPAGPLVIPGAACYVRFPERWVWAQVSGEAPHEPLDGVFAVAGPGAAEVTLLAVLGLRPEREGFSQIALTLPVADVTAARAAVRADRFAPVMDGGRAAGFVSLVSPAELLVVTQLALAQPSS